MATNDEKITQESRLIAISVTGSDDNFFLLQGARVRESISELFEIEVDLLHEEGAKPKVIKPEDVLGKSATIRVHQPDGNERIFCGIINRFTQGFRSRKYSAYKATIVPHVWVLTQNARSRIFQHISVPDILTQVFEGYQITDKIQHGDFKKRNFCVQYRESDFDFASRLMEEEGIYYYFQHEDKIDKLVLSNVQSGHIDCPNKSDIPLIHEKTGDAWESGITEWTINYNLQTGKITLWDHHFQIPTQHHEHTELSIYNAGANQDMEVYDFPGGYCQKYDEVDKSGGSTSDNNNIPADKEYTVKTLVQASDVTFNQSSGISDCCTLTAGHKFKLLNHPIKDLSRQYLLLSVNHDMLQIPAYPGLEETTDGYYRNSLVCIPFGEKAPVYRPQRRTPQPIVNGSQTATVVGPGGQEIHTDKYGRIKVKFHWDQAEDNTDNTAWVRVGRDIAGSKWGTMFIPRVGQEVIVDFLYGNPDQPIVVGSVYNQQTMPHYELPKYKTLTYIKTRTSPDDGKGYNELRFEDKANKEQVFVRSQKRYDLRVRGSMYETCGGSRSEVIGFKQENQPGGNLTVTVAGEHDFHVGTDQFITIDGSHYEGIKGDVAEEYKGSQKTIVTSSRELNAQSITLEAKTSIALKVGGSFITIDSSGVTISGPLVKINSGGAAMSTSPMQMSDAQDAEASDTGEPGYLDKPRTGGGGGRKWRTVDGQHAPPFATKTLPNGDIQVGNGIVIKKDPADPTFQDKVLKDMTTMSNYPTGMNTLNNLNNSGQTTTVQHTTVAGGNQSTPDSGPDSTIKGQQVDPTNPAAGVGTGKGTGSTIDYNPDFEPPTAADPTKKRPADVGLQHEMTHSDHFAHGQADTNPATNPNNGDKEEENTINRDNDYRKDRGVPTRADHTVF